MTMRNFVERYGYPLTTVVLLTALFVISVVHLLQQARSFSSALISSDIERLVEVFKKIDAECKIMGFDNQKTNIDFLNVEKFSGSEVGGMNLTLPRKWKGPYMQDNPEIQGKVYQIVRTGKGYFIVPGDGVRLSSGRVVGKDIVLDESSDIEAMTRDPYKLMFEGKPLAARITTSGIGDGFLKRFVGYDEAT